MRSGPPLQVASVVGKVLSDQVELDHPALFQRPGFLHQGLKGEGAVSTAPQRYGAERALVVAALTHLEIGHVAQTPDREPATGVAASPTIQ